MTGALPAGGAPVSFGAALIAARALLGAVPKTGPPSYRRCPGGVAVPLTCAGRPWRRLQVGSDGALLGCDGRRVVGDPVQLNLFDPPAALSAPTSAPVRRKGTFPPPAPERCKPLTAQERTNPAQFRPGAR